MKKMLPLALAVLVAPLLTAAEQKPLPKDLPPFGEDKPLPVPSINQSKLPNGLTVWVVKRAGYPRVVVKLAVRGGSASDPKDAPGISDLLADTLKEGTATRTSRQIAEELQSVGAEIGADESADAIYVTGTGLGSGAPKILEIVADVALRPAFPVAEVELAKGNALEGLKAQESTPGYLAQKALAQAIYGDHPYRIIGAT
jgi:predicted Zn-dependent peptidase